MQYTAAAERSDVRRGHPVVSLEGVGVSFAEARGGRYCAVAGIDLAVAPEEFVAIVGPTGCGKSTLLNVTAGLLRPSAGRVTILVRPSPGPTCTRDTSSSRMPSCRGRLPATTSPSGWR